MTLPDLWKMCKVWSCWSFSFFLSFLPLFFILRLVIPFLNIFSYLNVRLQDISLFLSVSRLLVHLIISQRRKLLEMHSFAGKGIDSYFKSLKCIFFDCRSSLSEDMLFFVVMLMILTRSSTFLYPTLNRKNQFLHHLPFYAANVTIVILCLSYMSI